MAMAAFLKTALRPEIEPNLVSEDIWSVLQNTASSDVYDKHAALYDKLIGSSLYNRIAWGSSPRSYNQFAKQSIRNGTGVLLDGGCGSLVSTADLHVASHRPTILCDLSFGMLCAARDRIITIAGHIPDNLVLLQADICKLPFCDSSFGSILCPGMLHIFENVEMVTKELARVATAEAQLFMSSLVAERWIGRRYLNILNRAGEVAIPRNASQLRERLEGAGSGLQSPIEARLEGSMMFLTASRA